MIRIDVIIGVVAASVVLFLLFVRAYRNLRTGTRMLRQYFPRGTDLARHSRDDLDAVAHALNSRPRKTLSWKTPAEALDELLCSAEQAGVATTA